MRDHGAFVDELVELDLGGWDGFCESAPPTGIAAKLVATHSTNTIIRLGFFLKTDTASMFSMKANREAFGEADRRATLPEPAKSC